VNRESFSERSYTEIQIVGIRRGFSCSKQDPKFCKCVCPARAVRPLRQFGHADKLTDVAVRISGAGATDVPWEVEARRWLNSLQNGWLAM
jgi:hypothetical protein